MALDILEQNGQQYLPAAQWPLPEWPCVVSKQPLPTLTLKEDDLFMITDLLGNISGCLEGNQNTSMGLFCRDSRFLSRLELQIDGRSPVLLSSNADLGFALSVLCANPPLPDITHDTIGIRRDMVLNGGLFEDIEVTNYSTEPASFTLSLSFDADFIDVFELRGYTQREQRGTKIQRLPSQHGKQIENEADLQALSERVSDRLHLAYIGLDGIVMESQIEFLHRPPDICKGHTALWHLTLEPHQSQKLGYRLQLLTDGEQTPSDGLPANLGQAIASKTSEEDQWLSQVARISSDNETFNLVVSRAEQDTYLLRQDFHEETTLSAGVPWFSTLFGRDTIIAATQTLMLDPSIAQSTLKLLAHYQGKTDNEWREEQPGKILHELRHGELVRCGEMPHTPYYGTVDATPLWVMLYADYYAWTNDQSTLETLWPNALKAMEWIDRACAETGYLAYYRKSKGGLDNQGWKDSWNCIVDRHGHLAQGSIALCEVQAYVYAARVRLAKIARMKKRLDLAEAWEESARDLKHRFNKDFWIDDLDFCALALDGEGKPVDSISSNPGHCLALDILTPEKAESVAGRLLAPDMFSGWGIRTLSSHSPAYNPMGYHIGSVWPHDNALIVEGLRSLNQIDAALEVSKGIFDMMTYQPYQRPPELFCGFERIERIPPVQYPVACSPQAWATGSVFHLLQMMLHLIPNAPSNSLRIVDPVLPDFLQKLAVRNLKIGSTVLDLEFERSNGSTACRVVRKRGNLRVVIET
ncbi:amylo-alpha-1,6-glucosidase [Sphaerothrix gracilis]|uniref:amylo-alpha-1,6-glucosidase n=1 Tax=Sphaerothrix gracilis TaxID=3151835 RepID=UPI0031FDBD3C